jgi:hypothetical protein
MMKFLEICLRRKLVTPKLLHAWFGINLVYSYLAFNSNRVKDTEKVWHHGVGGMYAGIHNRFMLGPRAWLGGGLGLAGGSLALTLRNNFGGIPLRKYQYYVYRHIQLVMDLYQNGQLSAPQAEFKLYHKMLLIYPLAPPLYIYPEYISP